MRSKVLIPMLLAAVVFGAAGFGIGLFMGGMDEQPVAAPGERPGIDDPAPAADDPSAESGRGGGRGGRSRHGAGRARPTGGGVAGIVGGAIAGLPKPEILVGAGVITGTVKTKDHEPVEGATVTIVPARETRSPDPRRREEIPAAELIEDYASRVLWTDANRRKAMSDETGAFRFEQCADSPHTLTAYKDGYSVVPGNRASARQARDGSEVHFVATPTIKVTAKLMLPDGTEAATGSISFKRKNHTETRNWSTALPFVEISEGAWAASAYSGAKQEFASKPIEVELEAGSEPPVLVFQLSGRPGIRGRVTFAGEESPPNALVWMAPIDAGAEVDGAHLQNGRQVWAQKGNGYEYQFLDLAPGSYAVGVARAHRTSVVAIEKIEVTDGPAERDIAVPALDPSEYVSIRALDPDGAAVRDISVQVGYQSDRNHNSSGATLIPMPDGTRRALHQPMPAGTTGGDYFVVVTSSVFGSARAVYQKGASSEVTVRFEPPAQLEVKITGHTGTRYAGLVRIALTRTEKRGRNTRNVNAGRQDVGTAESVTFKGLQPGAYSVSLTVGKRYSVRVSQAKVDLASGTNSASLDVPPLYSVTVHSAKRAYASGQGDRRGTTVWGIQADGKTVIDFLPAGEYDIRAGRERQKIAVPGTTDVRF